MIQIAVNMFLALAFVLGLMWLLARLVRRPLGGRGAGVMAVLARQPLTRGASVAVVRVGRQAFVLGVTDQTVTLLAETDPAAIEAAVNPPHEIREQIPLDGSVLSPTTWRRAVDAIRGGRKS
jgi:flagellar protein FliO/FliZ